MTSTRRALARLAAGAGALALAAGTLFAGASSALASAADITGTHGTLTIHKHDGVPGTPGDGKPSSSASLGAGLNDVTFAVQRVAYDGTAIDLTTSDGWTQASGATVANVATSGGRYSLAAAQSVTTANVAGVDGVAVLSNLPYGLYYVTETSSGPHPVVSLAQPTLVTIPFPDSATGGWLYNVHIYPKNKVVTTTPTKELADPGKGVVAGSTLTWTITAPIPPLATGDTYRSFGVTDPLDARLTVQSVTVTFDDGTPLSAGSDYAITPPSANPQVVTLSAAGLSKLPGHGSVKVVLVTQVKSPLAGVDPITNTATIAVNDATQTTTTGPGLPPKVNLGTAQVVKKDVTSGGALTGAQFELWTAASGGKLVAGPLATDANGKITFPAVYIGTGDTSSADYYLKEVVAPPGYTLPTGSAAFTKITVHAAASSSDVTSIDVTNTKQSVPSLPLTGSTGSLVFTIVGAGLVAVALVLFLVRRARSRAKTGVHGE